MFAVGFGQSTYSHAQAASPNYTPPAPPSHPLPLPTLNSTHSPISSPLNPHTKVLSLTDFKFYYYQPLNTSHFSTSTLPTTNPSTPHFPPPQLLLLPTPQHFSLLHLNSSYYQPLNTSHSSTSTPPLRSSHSQPQLISLPPSTPRIADINSTYYHPQQLILPPPTCRGTNSSQPSPL